MGVSRISRDSGTFTQCTASVHISIAINNIFNYNSTVN